MSGRVEIVEMSPRDGLQNEPSAVTVADRVRLVDLLSEAGFRRIEVASFVSPRWVPQMAHAAEVLAGINRRPGVRYTALTPNLKGFEAAIAAGADEVAIFASASEGFSRANLNCSISESIERFRAVTKAASAARVKVRGYVSMVTDCPFDGPVKPLSVRNVAVALRDLGCYEVSLGDTLGRATPDRLRPMLEAVLSDVPARALAGHFHDTGGRALENVAVALDFGLRVFDASAGGLGGCPYAPGASGNVDTERLADDLAARGFDCGLDRPALSRAAAFARSLSSRPPAGRSD